MSAVAPVQPALFAGQGFGGAEQERQRRLAKRREWLKHRDAVVAECARLNRSLSWYQARGWFDRAADIQRRIDRKLEAVKA